MQYGFMYKNGEYHVEEVPVKEIVNSVGTPCYIYSHLALEKSFNLYRDAFSKINPLICFSVKASSNLAILKIFTNLGAGFDIVSGGELFRVLRAGGDPSKVVFSGVGKTDEEMRSAIEAGILFFNVESVEELNLLDIVAKELGKKAKIALRVNPDIDPKTHPYISTGFKKSKFGIEIGKAVDVYRKAAAMSGIEVVGLDAHIGSQIFHLSPFIDSLRKLVQLADVLKNEGINIEYVDIGGGLGINYKKEEISPHPKEYADAVIREIGNTPYKLVLEPGRSLVGNAGILATKVIYLKEGTAKKFVIVDAAMNDLIRPAFYESYHSILPVDHPYRNEETVDIVGPICESGDFFAKDRRFPKVKRDDLLAILSAGAYGFTMSSNYNSRPRVPEVIVKGEEFFVVRQRETYEDLIRGETIPPDFMK
ncbi:MAG TPA: diaminopimelate decarboxylase [Thermodesulfobacteriota bacterium]|nr:diaminopimelate decarboxylase [Thermodesulfobacteriota bacterium]